MKIDMKAAIVVLVVLIMATIIYFLIPDIPPAPCSKSCHKRHSEGFDNLNANYSTLGSGFKQVYDTVYIEQSTGNLLDITVKSAPTSSTSPGPSTGPSPAPAPAPAPPSGDSLVINGVFGRNGGNTIATTNYSVNGTAVSNAKPDNSIASAYAAYNIVTNDKVQVFAMPWDKETYLAVFDLSVSPPKIANLLYVPDDGSAIKQQTMNYSLTLNSINVPTDDNDDKLITMNLYSSSRQLYQVCHNVFFDIRNGSLVMVLDRGINVYERVAQQKCDTPTPYYVPGSYSKDNKYSPKSDTIADVGLCAWIAVAEDILAIYISNEKLTMISTFCKEPNKTQYTLINCVRFLGNGTRDNGTTTGASSGKFNSGSYGTAFLGQSGSLGNLDPYGNSVPNWINYWDNITGGDLYNVINSSNYMLKSQYVPPSSATCPSCNGSSVCLNCGGNGGSGTLSNTSKTPSGESVQTPAESVASLLRDTGSGMRDLLKETGSGLKEMVKDTGSGLKTMTEETGSSLKELVKGGASGADSLARDTASGTVGLAKDTAKGAFGAAAYTTQGAVGLGKDVVGGTVGLGKDVVGGTLDLAKKGLRGAYDIAKDIGGEAKEITYDVAGAMGKGLTHLDRDIHAFGGPTRVQPIMGGATGGIGNQPNIVMSGSGSGVSTGSGASVGAGTGANKLLPGSDPMSYFGSLPNSTSTSDFIPVTTDFSAFRK